jgi:hypothetical protein
MRRSIIAIALYPPFVADCCWLPVEVVLLVGACCDASVEGAGLVVESCELGVLVAVDAEDAGEIELEAELEVEPEVALDWSGGFAAIVPSALDMMPLFATAPFDVVAARKVVGSGVWMFAIARCTAPLAAAGTNAAAPGAGMIMPMLAAKRSILASSLSDATLARSC